MSKKGIVEIQFNWVLILAAGAIILLFFSVVIMKQKSISEVSISSIILKNLEGILSGAEVSIGTVNSVAIPKTKIEFECNRYRIGKVSKEFEVMSVFTPSIIESNKLITWTLDWSLPYRVTNLLYLSSPRIRYIFVVDSSCIASGATCFGKMVFNSTPVEVRKEIIESIGVSSITDRGDDQVRIISFYDALATPSAPSLSIPLQNKKGVTALNVIGDEDKGQVNFYSSTGTSFTSKGVSHYIREPALMGAIFADDVDVYNCVMEDAFKKLNIVTKIYQNKTVALKDYYNYSLFPPDNTCATRHSEVFSILQNIQAASQTFNLANINAIDFEITKLEDKNELAQLYSCALIY